MLVFTNFMVLQIFAINSVNILFYSKSVILLINKFKSDQQNQIFKEFEKAIKPSKVYSACV